MKQLRSFRATGASATAALALAAAFAPAAHGATGGGGVDGPGNSETAAAQNCALAGELAARWGTDDAFIPLVWAASRKTGTGCPDGSDGLSGGGDVFRPPQGVSPQHNEILVRV